MKRSLPLNRAKWLVEPGCVVLVTGGTMEKANVMTISWQTPVQTADPCLVLLVMHQGRYTYELIRQNNELVINVPGADLLDQTHLVGTVSGRQIDKFKEAGLTAVPGQLVQPPLVAECAGHLECHVVQTFTVGNHDLLVCEVVHASVEEDFFDGAWIPEKFQTLHYMSATQYGLLGRRVDAGEDC
ncbi:MAG: flavin reductase family protein [Planctomycetes bacterium]|jgi:flavin reductase (DIM6/NTAB) family NADH-FMN oxidoreductase RutF|nr:flavin reductase family protein [Planctomycetota bacterium]